MGPGLFSPSVSLEWQVTDNLFRTGTVEDADGTRIEPTFSSIRMIRPGLDYYLPYSNSRLTLSYRPEWRDYSAADLPIGLSHTMRLANELVLSNAMTFDFDVQYVRGIVETTEIDPAQQLQFATTPFRRNYQAVSWSWEHPSFWGTAASAQWEGVEFLETQSEFTQPDLLYSGYRSRNLSLDATWQPREDLVVYGGTAAGRTDQDPLPGFEGDRLRDTDFHLGAQGLFTSRLMGETRVSLTRIAPSKSSEGFDGLELDASVTLLATAASQFHLALSRQPLQSLINQSDVFVYESAGVSWSFIPNPVHQLSLFAQYGKSTYSGADYRDDTTVTASGSWSVRVRDRARIQLSVTSTRRDSALAELNYDETRASVGLTLGWF